MNEVIFLNIVTKLFLRLVMATVIIFFLNSISSITHIFLSLNIFNIVMITIFDIFGLIVCIVLNIIL